MKVLEDIIYTTGKAEAQIHNLTQEIHSIRSDLKDIKSCLEKLTHWKYKVTGLTAGVSILGTGLFSKILKML